MLLRIWYDISIRDAADAVQCQCGICTRKNTGHYWCIVTQPVKGQSRDDTTETDVACYVNAAAHRGPISQHKLDMRKSATQRDEQLQSVLKLIKGGWHHTVHYYTVRDSLSKCEGLIRLGCHIIIPQQMRQERFESIHDGHQSPSRRRVQAKELLVAKISECSEEIWTLLPGKKSTSQKSTTCTFAYL